MIFFVINHTHPMIVNSTAIVIFCLFTQLISYLVHLMMSWFFSWLVGRSLEGQLVGQMDNKLLLWLVDRLVFKEQIREKKAEGKKKLSHTFQKNLLIPGHFSTSKFIQVKKWHCQGMRISPHWSWKCKLFLLL